MNNIDEQMHITPAIPEDAFGITEVLYKTWLATYPNEEFGVTKEAIEESYKDSFTPESIQKLQEKIRNSPNNELRLVAKIDDKIVGTGTMKKNQDGNFLRTLYVLPEYQGKGIGTLLWDTLLKHADSAKDITLQVATYNKKTISFYEKLRFIDSGKRTKDELNIPEMEMIRKTSLPVTTMTSKVSRATLFTE